MDQWDDIDPDPSPGPEDWRGALAPLIIVALVGIAVLWFTRPWWHGAIYGLAYVQPGLAWGLLLAGVSWGASFLVRRSDHPRAEVGTRAFKLLAATFVLMGLIVFPSLGTFYQGAHLAQETDARAEVLDALPQADPDEPRILPRSVGTQFAANSLQLPRHQLAGGDIAFVNGTPTWSFALRPDGAVNRFVATQAGAAFVDMTTTDKRIEIVEREMTCGPGMAVTDSLDWVLHKTRYLVEYQDPFYLVHEGELYGAVPFITYEHAWRFPTVYSVPRWGGVALIDEACEVTVLDPDQAREHPVLEGQQIYPQSLSRIEVNSMRYVNGILNKLFTHEGELELAAVPGMGNDQPFTVLTEEGIKYVLAAEPFGEAQGIFQIWVVDARTGEIGVLKMDPASSLLGPDKASQFVRKDSPRVDWSRLDVSEPLPSVVDGRLYWHVKVVPRDSAGIAFTAFVDADTGNVTEAQTTSDVKRFLRGLGIQEDVPAPEVEPPTEEPPAEISLEDIRLVLTDQGGATVLDERLEPGWTLRLEHGNRTLLVLTAPVNESG